MAFRILFWIVSVVMVGLYLILMLGIEPALAKYAGGLSLFDLRPLGYSALDVKAYFLALTSTGRQLYLDYWYPVDTGFLISLSAFFVLAIKALFGARAGAMRIVSVVLPLAYGVSDAVENLLVSALFQAGPENVQPGVIWLANVMTRSKFVIFATLILLLAVGVVRLLRRRFFT